MNRRILLLCALLAGAAVAAERPADDRARTDSAGTESARNESAQTERARTFDGGRVAYAAAGSVVNASAATAWPQLQMLRRGAFTGTIVYLHGCDGINALSLQTADMLAAAGYLVLLPDSFARLDKPVSCEPRGYRGGLHRSVLAWRHEEADQALARARTLVAVDPDRLYLYGLSEGAIATATYEGQAVRGRIVEGWTCHAGWPEYRGLRARAAEAVLTLSSENDPWFQDPVLRGDCGAFLQSPSALRRSVVFRPPHPAASHHDLMWNLDARTIVLAFLDASARAAP